MTDKTFDEIWNRLLLGRSLDDLSLGDRDGRIDLRGFRLPDPEVVRRFEFKRMPMTQIKPHEVKGAKWRNIDFSGGRLRGLRLFGCEIENCRFDGCDLQGLRMWSTSIRKTSFRGADLCRSALGPVQNGVRNTYTGVDFSEADLRSTSYQAAAFDGCVFRNTKLVHIDFQTSAFANCLFEGKLDDVLFYGQSFLGKDLPLNKMDNVDFTKSILRFVSFRGLALDGVRFPNDDQHVVIKNFDTALDQMIAAFERQDDPVGKKLIAFVRIYREWAVPNQTKGVINIMDLQSVVGDEGVKRFFAAVPQ